MLAASWSPPVTPTKVLYYDKEESSHGENEKGQQYIQFDEEINAWSYSTETSPHKLCNASIFLATYNPRPQNAPTRTMRQKQLTLPPSCNCQIFHRGKSSTSGFSNLAVHIRGHCVQYTHLALRNAGAPDCSLYESCVLCKIVLDANCLLKKFGHPRINPKMQCTIPISESFAIEFLVIENVLCKHYSYVPARWFCFIDG
jgi:hypothetical protein